jgi:hypothetical protein
VEAPQMVEMFPAYYIFNGLLSILLVLHVIWTYFIMKIAYNALSSSKVKILFWWKLQIHKHEICYPEFLHKLNLLLS